MKEYLVRSFDYKHNGIVYKSFNRVKGTISETDKPNIVSFTFENGTIEKYDKSDIVTSLPKNSFDVTDLTILPLYADIMQDIPAYYKFEPKVYKKAQMLVKDKLTTGSMRHEWYTHKDAESPLLIAVNSNNIVDYI